LNQSDSEDSRHFVAIKRIGVRPACVVREKQDVKSALQAKRCRGTKFPAVSNLARTGQELGKGALAAFDVMISNEASCDKTKEAAKQAASRFPELSFPPCRPSVDGGMC
jgi:hypothetical protein